MDKEKKRGGGGKKEVRWVRSRMEKEARVSFHHHLLSCPSGSLRRNRDASDGLLARVAWHGGSHLCCRQWREAQVIPNGFSQQGAQGHRKFHHMNTDQEAFTARLDGASFTVGVHWASNTVRIVVQDIAVAKVPVWALQREDVLCVCVGGWGWKE